MTRRPADWVEALWLPIVAGIVVVDIALVLLIWWFLR